MTQEHSSSLKRERNKQTQGIVLRKIPFKESSYICDVISPDFGIIKVIAQGIRKEEGKGAGLIETGNELQMVVYHNNSSEWYILRSAEISQAYILNTSYENQVLVYAAIEFYLALIIHSEDFAEIFQLLKTYLQYIREVKQNGILVFFRFVMRVFKVLGVSVNMKHCAVCAEETQEFVAYSLIKDGFICKNCYKPNHPEYVEFSGLFSLIIRNFGRIGKMLNSLKTDVQTLNEIERFICRHFENAFHKKLELNSLNLLKK